LLAGGAELDYKQPAGDVTGINATTEAAAVAVITGNSVNYDGSRVKVEFFTPEGVYVGGTGTNKLWAARSTRVSGSWRVTAAGGNN
jgi:hypothetical protein